MTMTEREWPYLSHRRSDRRQAAIALALLCLATQAAAQWAYRHERDQMTDGQNVEASVLSRNIHHFAFPYQGGTRATLVIRDHKKFGIGVLMWINRGQIGCYRDCSVQARFDDAEPQTFSASRASDGSSNVVFLIDGEKFIDQARTARRIRLSTTFYQHGDLMFEFRTPGLKWPPELPGPGNQKQP